MKNEKFISCAELDDPTSIYTLWCLIDGRWRCSNRRDISDMVLVDYLWEHGFEIPTTITYCLAANYTTGFILKYRVFGSKIHVYIKPIV